MDTIGSRMKQLRDNSGLSQKDIAALCKSSQATIAKFETGKALPSLKNALWYADYFNVSMDYICCRTDQPEGKLYEYKPRTRIKGGDISQFIEMCFDPDSPYSEKLKAAILSMMEEGDK